MSTLPRQINHRRPVYMNFTSQPLFSEKFPHYNPKIQSNPIKNNFKIKKKVNQITLKLYFSSPKNRFIRICLVIRKNLTEASNHKISYKPHKEKTTKA